MTKNAPNSGKDYSKTDERKIVNEGAKGVPSRDTAKDLGRTIGAIYDKRSDLNS